MARRLSPDVRRAEIIRRTREYIAVHGPAGLSMRALARWCGMSVPGILHHFDGLQQLLEETLAERDAEEIVAARAYVDALGPDGSLLDLLDGFVRRVAAHAHEARSFDALELEATANPDHPAHDYFTKLIVRPLPVTVELAERDFADPEAVVRVVSVIVDGLRHRWLRSPGIPDYIGDWEGIRDTVFAGFARRT